MKAMMLGIEISNPSSGPQGRVAAPGSDEAIAAGPGVALGRRDSAGDVELVDVELLGAGARHDDDLMPAIDRLCKRCSVRPADLGSIAVSVGPGGYTSLRIAVATAKMLAEATGAGAIAVRSDSVAAWAVGIRPPALVCLASKGATAWCSLLPPARNDAWWPATGDAALGAILSRGELVEVEQRAAQGYSWLAASVPLGILGATSIEALQPRLIIADRFLPVLMREAADRFGVEVAEPVFAAEFVLKLAAGQEEIDPLALAPLYPREAEAVTQWRKRAR